MKQSGVSTGKPSLPRTSGRGSVATAIFDGELDTCKEDLGRELEWFLLTISKVLGLEIYLWRVC